MERRIKKTSKSGFVLIEMLIAILVFSLMITTIVAIFVVSYKAQEESRAMQNDIENMRISIESMAKNIRTSTLDYSDANSSGEAQEIYIFNYSQERCIGYKFEDAGDGKKVLEFAEQATNRLGNDGEIVNCNFLQGESFTSLIGETELNEGKFIVKETGSNSMGQVTILMQIEEDDATFETTVSLRDY